MSYINVVVKPAHRLYIEPGHMLRLVQENCKVVSGIACACGDGWWSAITLDGNNLIAEPQRSRKDLMKALAVKYTNVWFVTASGEALDVDLEGSYSGNAGVTERVQIDIGTHIRLTVSSEPDTYVLTKVNNALYAVNIKTGRHWNSGGCKLTRDGITAKDFIDFFGCDRYSYRYEVEYNSKYYHFKSCNVAD